MIENELFVFPGQSPLSSMQRMYNVSMHVTCTYTHGRYGRNVCSASVTRNQLFVSAERNVTYTEAPRNAFNFSLTCTVYMRPCPSHGVDNDIHTI